MTEIINTTKNEPKGNWKEVGVVMGVVVVKHDDLTTASVVVLEQHAQKIRDARQAALSKMNARALELKAHAVVGVRFDNSTVNSTHAIAHTVEYTAYGTAVKFI